MMKVFLLLLSVLLLLTVSIGCKQTASLEPEISSEIRPFREAQDQNENAKFQKIAVTNTEPDPNGVTFHSVGFAADKAYIMVQFSAPLEQSSRWQQGYIYVVDEETLKVYKEVPVMPVVGPLIGRPNKEGQVGYVMLINHGYGIKPGSVVSVVIGDYKREHYVIPG